MNHKPRKKLYRINKHDDVIEYDVKTMITRASILVTVLVFVLFVSIRIVSYNSEIEVPNNYVESYNSTLINEQIIESKSFGDFKSLDENVVVQGYLEVKFEEEKRYVYFHEFKVTKNKNLRPALSTNIAGRSIVYLGDKLLGTVGDQQYYIPNSLKLDTHKFFILWDTEKNKPIVYANLK